MRLGAAVAIGVLSCSKPPTALRMIELAEHPERYESQALVVDIVESLRASDGGPVEVEVPELDRPVVLLGLRVDTPTPVRVHGTLVWRGRSRLFASSREPCWRECYAVRVTATEPLVDEAPVVLRSLDELPRWDRHLVTYEGVWRLGFEHSLLDGRIWLDPHGVADRTDLQPTQRALPSETLERRVRVTGRLFARPGAHYGHMGESSFEIHASRIERLAPPHREAPR